MLVSNVLAGEITGLPRLSSARDEVGPSAGVDS